MRKFRKHERGALRADLIFRSSNGKLERYAGQALNASEGGVAVFSQRTLPAGELVGLELFLPQPGEGVRRITLFGAVRWMRALPEGNILGVELLMDDEAGDYEWFLKHFGSDICPSAPRRSKVPNGKGGFTLMELSIAMVIICLMMTLAAPIFTRAIECSRMDAAVANLKILWAAQRAYWLEERYFAPDLSNLQSMDLVDSAIVQTANDPSAVYVYEAVSANESEFVCRATRHNSTVWSGQILIDEEGTISGTITSTDGSVLTPIP
ncbi:MAG: prepilin-type N-terminal cleavage/methylation domain-containing protein [Phycisphaerae bacterium]|nr:prepilin-type N-terminal cleavage/methylation domain-containing protein [Phycisphaerae bacterium]